MYSALSRLAFAVVLIAVSACSDDAVSDFTVRSDSAGIAIVRYDGEDREPPFTLHETFRLGGSDTRPGESFYAVHSSVVGIDDDGRIHVLDLSGHRVVTFDTDGRFIREVGRSGGGPGEFMFPAGLAVAEDGTVGVVDFGRRGLVRFGVDGQPLDIVPLPGRFRGGLVRTRGGALTTTISGQTMADMLIRVVGDDTARVATLEPAATKSLQLTSCGMGFTGMPPLFTPTLRWAEHGPRLAVATSEEYDVAVFDGGRESMRIRRGIPPERATIEVALEELGEGMKVRTEAANLVCDPREVAEKRGLAPVVPAVGEVAVAPDGTIWVQRGGPARRPRAVDIFTASGDYIGTMPAGSPFPVAFFADGRIAATETDDMDVMRLVVYERQERR